MKGGKGSVVGSRGGASPYKTFLSTPGDNTPVKREITSITVQL